MFQTSEKKWQWKESKSRYWLLTFYQPLKSGTCRWSHQNRWCVVVIIVVTITTFSISKSTSSFSVSFLLPRFFDYELCERMPQYLDEQNCWTLFQTNHSDMRAIGQGNLHMIYSMKCLFFLCLRLKATTPKPTSIIKKYLTTSGLTVASFNFPLNSRLPTSWIPLFSGILSFEATHAGRSL